MRSLCTTTFLLMTGCATAPATGAGFAEVMVGEARVTRQTFTSITVECHYQLNNPTAASARVASIAATAKLGSDHSATTQLAGIAAEPHSRASGSFDVTLPWPGEHGELAASGAKEIADIVVTAAMLIRGNEGDELYEGEWHTNALRPERLAFTLAPLAARTKELVEVSFTLGVENTNSFPVRVHDVSYEIFLEGASVLNGSMSRDTQLQPGSRVELALHRYVGAHDLVDLAEHLIRQPGFAYRAVLEARLDERTAQDEITGRANFAR